jgi:hypothetical protein
MDDDGGRPSIADRVDGFIATTSSSCSRERQLWPSSTLTRVMALLLPFTFMARERGVEVSRSLLGIGHRVSRCREGPTACATTAKGGSTVDIRHIL